MNVTEGNILHVDLSSGEISFESHEKSYKKFLGGRGVNQYILFNKLPQHISPFDPQNIIVLGAGLLNGTQAPTACRMSIDTKNVLTGGIGSSNVGGCFGPEMRRAGITNIVITGKAKKLSYLTVEDEEIELKDASHLKQKTISETEKMIGDDTGNNFQIMSIGPAGENLVRSACIIVNGARVAARCGTGAVMGSKNLKAIAVRGNGMVEVANSRKFEEEIERCNEKLLCADSFEKIQKYGIYFNKNPWIEGPQTPYKNFSGEHPNSEEEEKLKREKFFKYKIGRKGCCDACPLEGWSVYGWKENGKTITVEQLQYNAIHNFGYKLGIFEPKEILKAHTLANNLGLDEDNLCGVIAWAIECYKKGLLTRKDTDGVSLEGGNTEVISQLMEKIAYREGIGDLLAEGCKRASAKIGRGTEKYCVHVKGQELFETLWLSPAWSLGTVVSPRGGTHTRGAIMVNAVKNALSEDQCRELFGCSVGEMTSYENKEKLVFFMEKFESVLDCMGMCFFVHGIHRKGMLMPTDLSALLSAAMGHKISSTTLLAIGESVTNLEKSFNVLHTEWTRKNDYPPKKFMNTPLKGKDSIDREKWKKMLNNYYELHRWDKRTGWPTRKTLEDLDLQVVANKLKKYEKLPNMKK